MFEIGFWELVVVGLVALWVLGPSRLPAVAKVCARWLIRAKQTAQNIKSEFDQEFQKITSEDSKNNKME